MKLGTQHNTSRGFTIVELLIVIVVIGILAVITIVAFNGVQNRASDAAVQSDLAAVGKKMAAFNVDNFRYPNNVTELTSLELRTSKSAYATNRMLNFSYCTNADKTGYAIGGISKSGKQFYVSSTSGVKEYAATLLNDGNREDIGTSCSDLLPGGTRLQGGYYTPDTPPWRSWTGA